MENMYSSDLARKTALAEFVYNQRASYRDDSLGPHLRSFPFYRDVFEHIQESLHKVFQENPHIALSGVVHVESPWHAALYLEEIQQHFLSQNQRVIFRGQYDSSWDIISSIARPNLTEADKLLELKKSSLFVDIMSSLSFNTATTVLVPGMAKHDPQRFPSVRVGPDAYLAAAQHYQIATNLIDWTPDSAVATYFAAAGPKEPSRTASVYVMGLADAMDAGFEILIPPPFVERLHLQRGFFVREGKHPTRVYL
jgi:hypothetical protein